MAKNILACLMMLFFLSVHAQSNSEVYGVITDGISSLGIDYVTIYVDGTTDVVESDEVGRYAINVPSDRSFTLVFARIGYKQLSHEVQALPASARQKMDILMVPLDSDFEVVVTESKVEQGGMISQHVENIKLLPSASGNLESVLPHIALGASSGTGGELTSQYNVRGGNYDENLVYVNGFEIYRPQLISNAEQEGLSFPNIDLIQSLSFSSGGFEAKYGDKMSSVLDIQYKRPDSLAGSISASLLGAAAHVEGSAKLGQSAYKKLRFLAGLRYKTQKYLLGSLDVQGEYQPTYTDIQTYLTYDISRDLQVGWLANFRRSCHL